MRSWWLRRALLGALLACAAAAACTAGYRVYVYDLPAALLRPAEEARAQRSMHVCRKCIYEQFALEYVMFDHFTQFCGRTYRPEEADYFYLPIVRDLDYRIALQKGDRNPGPTDLALLDALERHDFTRWHAVFNVTSEFFRRHGGADHLLIMPAPVTNFRHQTNMRGFFHYMPQLLPPVFLSVELSRSFVREYPACAAKNLVLPYPLTDSELFSHAYERQYLAAGAARDKLLFYQGGSLQRGDRKREEGFLRSAFCPIPVGDSPSCKRMYDALSLGCVPVLLSDDALWPFSPLLVPSERVHIDPWEFSIQLPQSIAYASAGLVLREQRALLESFAAHSVEGRAVQREVLHALEALGDGPALHPLDRNVSQHLDARGRKRPRFSASEFPSLLPPPTENTLTRLLSALPAPLVQRLQRNVQRHADAFLFYEKDPSAVRPPDPLTANHTRPTGKAIRKVDAWLRERRGQLLEGARLCAQEAAAKHQYVGQFPCHT